MPTLRELLDKNAAVIVLAHFDRPKGKVVPEMSLKPVAPALEQALGRPVKFIFTDWQSAARDRRQARRMRADGEHPLSSGRRKERCRASPSCWRASAISFVNDAFSAAHRAHTSTEGIAHLIPAYAGRAMEAELRALEAALEKPKRPLVAVVGGAKVSTKLELLGNLSGIANTIVIGGGMANTFLAAQGYPVGKSLCEHDLAANRQGHHRHGQGKGTAPCCCPSMLWSPRNSRPIRQAAPSAIADVAADDMILDVGAKTDCRHQRRLRSGRNPGVERPARRLRARALRRGDRCLRQACGKLTKAGKLVSVAGGGDTVAALNHAGVADDFTYISTAGGAFLEWLEGKPLPGVKALEERT